MDRGYVKCTICIDQKNKNAHFYVLFMSFLVSVSLNRIEANKNLISASSGEW